MAGLHDLIGDSLLKVSIFRNPSPRGDLGGYALRLEGDGGDSPCGLGFLNTETFDNNNII